MAQRRPAPPPPRHESQRRNAPRLNRRHDRYRATGPGSRRLSALRTASRRRVACPLRGGQPPRAIRSRRSRPLAQRQRSIGSLGCGSAVSRCRPRQRTGRASLRVHVSRPLSTPRRSGRAVATTFADTISLEGGAGATTCLRSGVPLGETARRLGHTVETLVSTYVGAVNDIRDCGDATDRDVLGRRSAATRRGAPVVGAAKKRYSFAWAIDSPRGAIGTPRNAPPHPRVGKEWHDD